MLMLNFLELSINLSTYKNLTTLIFVDFFARKYSLMKKPFLTGCIFFLMISFSCTNKTVQDNAKSNDTVVSQKATLSDTTLGDNLEDESSEDFTDMYWDIIKTIQKMVIFLV